MPILHRLQQLRDSFWFVPAVMAVLSALMAVVTARVDEQIGRGLLSELGWLWHGSAEGARSVLTVVAGSTMTVAGVVFSITVTALAQTSAHFGPRVLRNFTADRGNQIVLGTFIATFVYCLLVLRTVRAGEDDQPASIPFLSVNVGLALAVASIGVLIFFIHHIVRELQVEVLLAGIGRDFREGVESLFPARRSEAAPADAEPLDESYFDEAESVCAGAAGYLQGVDRRRLLRLVRRHDLRLYLHERPGDFVSHETPVLRVRGAAPLTASLRRKLQDCLAIGDFRTPVDDASYPLQQLVEVAARALSPGVNEVFTALTSIDWAASGLETAARRERPAGVRADAEGVPRLLVEPPTFGDLAGTLFDTLRPYAATSALVAARLLQALERLAGAVHRLEDRQVLAEQLAALCQAAAALDNPADRANVDAQAERSRREIESARLRIQRRQQEQRAE